MIDELIDKPTIMVVDDDDQGRNLLAELLESCGYRTKVAANGLSAIQQIDKDIPDVVLLDLNMPVMDGYRVLELLCGRSEQATPRVIVITAQEPQYMPGAVAVLRKPVNVRQLLELIRELSRPSELSSYPH
jgi:CheY-like chemotaxis protein